MPEQNQPQLAQHLIGNIEPFLPGGNFTTYEHRIKQFFIINGATEAKKIQLFITIMGADVYGILASLTAPSLPSELM